MTDCTITYVGTTVVLKMGPGGTIRVRKAAILGKSDIPGADKRNVIALGTYGYEININNANINDTIWTSIQDWIDNGHTVVFACAYHDLTSLNCKIDSIDLDLVAGGSELRISMKLYEV